MSVTKKEIKAALSAYLRASLDLNEEKRLKCEDQYQTDIRAIDFKTLKDIGKPTPKALLRLNSIGLKDELLGREGNSQLDDGKMMSEQVDDFLKSSGLEKISKDDLLYKFVYMELLKVEQAVNRIEEQRLQGDYNTQTELSILAAYPDPKELAYQAPPVEKKKSRPISKVVEQYISENISDGKWKPSTLKEYNSHLKTFVEVTGDSTLTSADHTFTRAFFDSLKKIPANRNKVKIYRDKSITELLNMELSPEKCLSPKTINNIMQSVSVFFNWAVARQYMSQDFTKGMRLKIDTQAHELKDAFTDMDLKIIFDNLKVFRDKPGHIYRWWVPLIGLYTGARLEEICQLHIDDVRQEDGVWVFDINELGDKSVKNVGSRRLVPIHAYLIKNGFMGYFNKVSATGSKRLFPTLKSLQGKYGHYISKWFGPYLGKVKVKTDKHRVSYHSFRHTFATKAKHSDIPEMYISQIVGHQAGTITYSRYGKGYKIEKLKAVIDKIVFEIKKI